MYRQFFCSRRWALHAYGLGTVIVGLWVLNSQLNVMLNDWSRRFFDSMQESLTAHEDSKKFVDPGESWKVVTPLFLEWG